MPQPERRRAGLTSGVAARSLALVLVGGFVAAGVYRLLGDQTTPTVDTTPAFQAARDASAFPVASPAPLPTGWRALESDFGTDTTGPTLRIGLRAPGGGAVRLVESANPSGALLTVELGARARAQGDVHVEGRRWQRYLGEGGVRALVLHEPERTLILAGTAQDAELRGLAETLC